MIHPVRFSNYLRICGRILEEQKSGLAFQTRLTQQPLRRDTLVSWIFRTRINFRLSGATEYSFLPHARWPQYAVSSGLRNRMVDWNWVTREVQTNISDREWLRADRLGALADVFALTSA